MAAEVRSVSGGIIVARMDPSPAVGTTVVNPTDATRWTIISRGSEHTREGGENLEVLYAIPERGSGGMPAVRG